MPSKYIPRPRYACNLCRNISCTSFASWSRPTYNPRCSHERRESLTRPCFWPSPKRGLRCARRRQQRSRGDRRRTSSARLPESAGRRPPRVDPPGGEHTSMIPKMCGWCIDSTGSSTHGSPHPSRRSQPPVTTASRAIHETSSSRQAHLDWPAKPLGLAPTSPMHSRYPAPPDRPGKGPSRC